jgi:hypothetical protein
MRTSIISTHGRCLLLLPGLIVLAVLVLGRQSWMLWKPAIKLHAPILSIPSALREKNTQDCRRSVKYLRHYYHTRITRAAGVVADTIIRNWRRKEGPTAIVLLSNAKYRPRFDEMIATWSNFLSRDAIVMAALDDDTYTYFQTKGIHAIHVFPDNKSTMHEAIMRAKVELPYGMLLHGMRVVMVEMDVYCRSNPLVLDTGLSDVFVSAHADSNEEVNIGFWIAHPSCEVIDSFRRMHVWITSPNREGAYCDHHFDQKLMHFAWLGNGSLSPGARSRCQGSGFPQRDQLFDPRFNDPVALRRIPVDDIMHWPVRNTSNPICVHIWSGYGPASAQMIYGYRHKWVPKSSEKHANNALDLVMHAASINSTFVKQGRK